MPSCNIVEHYHYNAGWCEGPQCYVATCAEFQGLTAQGDTAENALATLKAAVRDVVAGMYLSGEGRDVPEPLDEPFIDCP